VKGSGVEALVITHQGLRSHSGEADERPRTQDERRKRSARDIPTMVRSREASYLTMAN